MNAAGSDTVDEWVNIIHREDSSVDVFKEMVKYSLDCQHKTEYVIKKNRNG